jgi:hypothetical protein
MTTRTIEIDDTLQDCVDSATEDVGDLLKTWLVDNWDNDDDSPEPDTPCLHNDLDYSGSVHEIVDSSVPVYTAEITDIFYLHGQEVEDAFDNAGIGDKNDDDWPMGWRAAAIFTYIEQSVAEWYDLEADDIVAEWYANRVTRAIANGTGGFA